MPRTLKKTAVIGVGGTGRDAVLYMKKRLIDTYGEVPPMIRFLVFDTTTPDSLKTGAGDIGLDPGEFVRLSVRDPRSLIDSNDEVRAWLPQGPNMPLFALSNGAKQVRPLGRLAAFANSHSIETAVNALISGVKDFRVDRGDRYDVASHQIVVNLVCSLSGGTGSGCYLDIAMLVRERLASDDNDRLIGYFLMPDIFVGRPATDNVEPNAYGAIRELNALYEQVAFDYRFAGKERRIRPGLFKVVYLVNKTNRQGVEYNDVADLVEFLGIGMYVQSSAAGKGATDLIDNIESQTLSKIWYGKRAVFCSFGVSELVYPAKWYGDLYAYKIALSTVRAIEQRTPSTELSTYTDDMIRRLGIREHEADDVIDAIAQPGDFAKFPLPKEFKKEIIGPTLARRETHVNDVLRSARQNVKARAEALKQEKIETLRAELMAKSEVPSGVDFTRGVLLALVRRLDEFKQEMSSERDTLENQRKELDGRYALAKVDAEAAAKSIFGARGKIEEALKKYKALVDRECSLVFEIERREKAIDFFAHLVNEAQTALGRLDALLSFCSTEAQELSQRIEKMTLSRGDMKPFLFEIKPPRLTDITCDVRAEDFLAWLRDERKLHVTELGKMRAAEFESLLLDYARRDPRVVQVTSLGVEDVLRELSVEERMKYVTRLDRMASPLWQYDQGRISGDKKTENIYLFGVSDRDNTVFEPQEIKTFLEAPFPPDVVSTGDPSRVICFKVEAAVPAFVVRDMERYRAKYVQQTVPYQLHKDWQAELPEVFPGSGDDNRKYWSLALAEPFDLIVKQGEHYYLRSQKRGKRVDSFLVKLGQGRRDSMKRFMEDRELVGEVMDTIQRVNRELGNQIVCEKLTVYGNTLEARARKQVTDDIRELIELELQDIESYIQALA